MSIERIEVPVSGESNSVWGSDLVVSTLRDMGIRYVALNPGASFRGLHDSIVNYGGNRAPQMILCLHEETAIALAHGFAKVAGEPMAAAVHSNVGLMHGSMSVFNAWCDRTPVLILGATGPADASQRRPWIEWIHTAQDQAALVRPFVKWDNHALSEGAAVEALLRANKIMRTAPEGPVYVCLDVSLQERQIEAMPPRVKASRYAPPARSRPSREALVKAASALEGAARPVILIGRGSRDGQDWARRVALAEHLDAPVLTDLKLGAVFPTEHRLHPSAPTNFPTPAVSSMLRQADVILSLDWVDLDGSLRAAFPEGDELPTVIHASVDQHVHNGWSMDHLGLAPVDIGLLSDGDTALTDLCERLGVETREEHGPASGPCAPAAIGPIDDAALTAENFGTALGAGLDGETLTLTRLPLGWKGACWHFRHPLDYIGHDGGGGIGSGPGMSVGAALALSEHGRIPVAVLGDGDLMMGISAVWTAVHYRIPLLIVVWNNTSFFNDEVHQEAVARRRGRPPENRWIGQRVEDPAIDFVALVKGQGGRGFGPVGTVAELAGVLPQAVEAVKAGHVVVVDARVQTAYDPSMAKGMLAGARNGKDA